MRLMGDLAGDLAGDVTGDVTVDAAPSSPGCPISEATSRRPLRDRRL
jgi:hypothetical protein